MAGSDSGGTITQGELAELAGVSRQLVQRALTGHPYVEEAKRRQIQDLARRYGYRPNAAARAMRSGRQRAIGLVLSPSYGRARVPEPLFHAIREELRRRDLHLVVGDLPDETLGGGKELPRILREWAVDGLLVNFTHQIPAGMVEVMARQPIPSVWLNTRLKSNCVYPDDFEGARWITHRLIDAGHRRVAFVCLSASDHYSVGDRSGGYAEAMRARGLEAVETPALRGRPRQEQVRELRQLLMGPNRLTAVIAYGLDEATVVSVLAGSLGLTMPRDLSLAVFHQDAGTDFGFGPLSIMRLPAPHLAGAAVERLTDREPGGTPFPPLAVQYIFEPGATVAPPPSP